MGWLQGRARAEGRQNKIRGGSPSFLYPGALVINLCIEASACSYEKLLILSEVMLKITLFGPWGIHYNEVKRINAIKCLNNVANIACLPDHFVKLQ